MTPDGFEVRELQSKQTSIPAYPPLFFLIKKNIYMDLYFKGNFTWSPFE